MNLGTEPTAAQEPSAWLQVDQIKGIVMVSSPDGAIGRAQTGAVLLPGALLRSQDASFIDVTGMKSGRIRLRASSALRILTDGHKLELVDGAILVDWSAPISGAAPFTVVSGDARIDLSAGRARMFIQRQTSGMVTVSVAQGQVMLSTPQDGPQLVAARRKISVSPEGKRGAPQLYDAMNVDFAGFEDAAGPAGVTAP